jgi:hypothetical protein
MMETASSLNMHEMETKKRASYYANRIVRNNKNIDKENINAVIEMISDVICEYETRICKNCKYYRENASVSCPMALRFVMIRDDTGAPPPILLRASISLPTTYGCNEFERRVQ